MSYLGNILGFLGELGLYDVVLPFLLIFTITFAILEKTRVLGEEEISGKKYPRRNLNSMVAFVVALVMLTATRLIAFINKFLAIAALIMVIGVGFLMMVGVFYMPSSKNKDLISQNWVKVFTIIIFISTLLIILHLSGLLEDIYYWLTSSVSGQILGSIIFLIIIFALIAFIVKAPSENEEES